MFLIVFIIILVSLSGLVVYYWKEFSRELNNFARVWFLQWLRRGVVIPILVWMLMNLGSMPLMPPLTPQIARLRAGGRFLEALLLQSALATMVIVSCWAALTFGWFMAGLLKKARNREDLILAGIVWLPAGLPVLWFFLHFYGFGALGFAALFWIWPLSQYCLTEASTAIPPPTYSGAIARMKFGKYSEAERVIIAELEKCETDFEGWMMLAELYANQFQDLTEAEKTIMELCAEPTTNVSQVSVALNRLADWQLHLRNDLAAARRVLQEIRTRMPGTHLAMMAQKRIDHLPASLAELQEHKTPRKIQMPALNEDFGEKAGGGGAIDAEKALALANELVEKLRENPRDMAAREKLARIFAEQLGRYDLGAEQLELLEEMPERPDAKVAGWLALRAAWLARQEGQGVQSWKILERLVREFPQSTEAFAAQRRLGLMAADARMKSA